MKIMSAVSTIWKGKSMLKIVERLDEPSTYAGAAAILMGLDKIFNLHGVPEAAAVVAQAGQVAGQGGGFYMPLGMLLAGLAAVFVPERKAKK